MASHLKSGIVRAGLGLAASLGLGMVLLPVDPQLGVAVFLTGMLGAPLAIGGVLARRAWLVSRFQLAWAREDTATIKKLLPAIDRWQAIAPDLETENVVRWATVLGFGDARWAEALLQLDELSAPARESEHVRLLRAWCLVHTGRLDEAHELVQSLALSDENPYAVGLSGVLAHASADPARAVPILRDAVERAGPHRHLKSLCALHLGEALASLGRDTDARAAFVVSFEAAPKGPFAREAQAHLTVDAALPYR